MLLVLVNVTGRCSPLSNCLLDGEAYEDSVEFVPPAATREAAETTQQNDTAALTNTPLNAVSGGPHDTDCTVRAAPSTHGSAVWPCVITFTEELCATSW